MSVHLSFCYRGKNMSKLLFFDIDGTLIECHKGIYAISPANQRSLDELKANGHHVFLATGRCQCFITEGVYFYPFDGYVTCNGGYVEYQKKPIFKAVVPAQAIKATMQLAKEMEINYYFEANDKIYVADRNDPRHKEFARNWGMKPETIIDDFDPEQIETYIGMVVVKNKADIPAMIERLSPYFDVQRHQSEYSFDLTLRGVSKALGIAKIVAALNQDMADTIAFGDGRNDVEMLQSAGIGVAMKNAMPEALAAADEICDAVENDGITSWLQNKKLITYKNE